MLYLSMFAFFRRYRIYYMPTIEEDIHRYSEFIVSLHSNVETENSEQDADEVGFTCTTDGDQYTGVNSLVNNDYHHRERLRMILAYRYE